MIVLDSDLVSLFQQRDSALKSLLIERINRALASHDVLASVVTYEEQMRGWLKVIKEANSMREVIGAYARLQLHLDYYRRRILVDFDEKTAVEFQRLRGLKVRIGTMDLRIAAITLANGARLWTRNLRDFRRVPGLLVEDPLADGTL